MMLSLPQSLLLCLSTFPLLAMFMSIFTLTILAFALIPYSFYRANASDAALNRRANRPGVFAGGSFDHVLNRLQVCNPILMIQ